MVLANYKLLTEHLNVDHLRLVMGTSMGGMHTWMWATPTLTLWMHSCLWQACQWKSPAETAFKENGN
jgi:homoserine acetyltransferase